MDAETLLRGLLAGRAQRAGDPTMAAIRFFGRRDRPAWLAMGHGLPAGQASLLPAWRVVAHALPTVAGFLLLAAAVR